MDLMVPDIDLSTPVRVLSGYVVISKREREGDLPGWTVEGCSYGTLDGR